MIFPFRHSAEEFAEEEPTVSCWLLAVDNVQAQASLYVVGLPLRSVGSSIILPSGSCYDEWSKRFLAVKPFSAGIEDFDRSTRRTRLLGRQPRQASSRQASSPANYFPDFSTAARMICLNSSTPSSNAAEIPMTLVRGTRRLNFFRFSTAAASSILLATTSRGFSTSAGS